MVCREQVLLWCVQSVRKFTVILIWAAYRNYGWQEPCHQGLGLPSSIILHEGIMALKHFPHYRAFVRGVKRIQRGSGVSIWHILCCKLEQTVELSVIWDAMVTKLLKGSPQPMHGDGDCSRHHSSLIASDIFVLLTDLSCTKWAPFSDIFSWKVMYLDWNFTEVCS